MKKELAGILAAEIFRAPHFPATNIPAFCSIVPTRLCPIQSSNAVLAVGDDGAALIVRGDTVGSKNWTVHLETETTTFDDATVEPAN